MTTLDAVSAAAVDVDIIFFRSSTTDDSDYDLPLESAAGYGT